MREYIVIVVIFSLLLFLTPLAFSALSEFGEEKQQEIEAEKTAAIPKMHFPDKVTVLISGEDGDNEQNQIELTTEEYLIGCLFAQIPVNYHEEALKAQAVAAHTYMLRLLLDGEEISDDPTTAQPFFTEEAAREHYGDEYETHLKRIQPAANYGANRAIAYNGEPIYAVYHSISAGVTNTAYSVWGRDFPYLKSVESSWDRGHPDYLCVNEMTSESIRLAMFGYNRTASMPIDYALWFVNPIKNDYGYVISVKAGENLLSGGDMWRIFKLRSTSFEISFRPDGIFSAETRGFGHGVGLSQYGADVLGNRGFSAEEILAHYYTDVDIVF
ncbi:MAG: SpoIID/LytB domain-containing protein [Oscillospiraceae bacterium]|nr:SpoIID/LytB domain-containing protein [Oscillospiraceae bacterium]